MSSQNILRVLICCATLITFALSSAAANSAPKVTTLYNFTGIADGGDPMAGLTSDSAGNLWGTGLTGGNYDSCDEGGACGVVFELTPPAQTGGNWTETAVYEFQYQDPYPPASNLVFDHNGNLYGSTEGPIPSATLYQLADVSGNWTLNSLYVGTYGIVSPPLIDAHDNLYFTVAYTSGDCCGLVLELSPQSNGTWTQSTLYTFAGGNDGDGPAAGVIADRSGNLYGTTTGGGGSSECGTVFELSRATGGAWTEKILYSFTGADGCNPYAGLVLDGKGNLYGTTYTGGVGPCINGCGLVFELSPAENGTWSESTLHAFTNKDGANPYAALVIDPDGGLYGTTVNGGNGPCEPTGVGCGTVFRLAPPSKPGGTWTQMAYSFQGHNGVGPRGSILLDKAQNTLYGTTSGGGTYGYGTVFQIAP